ELWAGLTNAALERAGVGERVSHLSHAARGLAQAPTAHLGPSATALERRGVETDRGDTNRAVEAHRKAQEAVAGNEALLPHLDKAARAAERLQAKQQAAEWERRDQAALTRYRAAVEQAEAKGDELEIVEQRGRLAKATELAAAGKHLAHFGTAINQAGEQAVRELRQDQARRNQVKEPVPELSPEEARKMAYRAMTEQELREQIQDLRRDTTESRLNADPIFRQRVESLDKCSRETVEAREKADKARRDLRGVDAMEAAYRQNHPLRAWLHDKGLLGSCQIAAWEQQRHGLETSITTADDAVKAREAAEKRAHDVAVERQEDILPGIKAALEPKRQQAAEMDEVLTEKRTVRYAREEAERQAKRASRGKGLGR
ncbi:MobA/MobL family protein, partial [Acidocella aromatica]